MSKMSGWLKGLLGLLLLAAFGLALAWLLRLGGQGPAVGQQAAPTDTPLPAEQIIPTDISPLEEGTLPAASPEPYIPSTIQPTSVPSPTTPAEGPETPPVPGRAATLFKGDVWLVEKDRVPEAMTSVGDVAAIFGWNWDGTKLLIGRGRHVLGGDIGDTTELWLLDRASQQMKQLTATNLVAGVGWSPVDDRVAYCERGDVLTVVTLDNQVLHQRKNIGCSFTWAPDGSAMAVETYTPDMVAEDGLKYSILAVWQLSDETLRLFSDAKDESQYWPVWSTDGLRILFQRDFYEPSKQKESGWYIAEVNSGVLRRVEGTPAYTPEEIRRSPRADLVAYRVGPDLYVMDFEGRIDFTAPGHSSLWAPDGKTLFYRGTDNRFQVAVLESEVMDSAVGGAWPSPGLYTEPEYFFAPGGSR
jgi:hypothetical protein